MKAMITKSKRKERKIKGPTYEMAELLVTWMQDQIQKHIPFTLMTTEAKAQVFRGAG
jgi:hypothetical protein